MLSVQEFGYQRRIWLIRQLIESKNTPRRVFLIDDHPIVRHGLTQVINQEPDLMVCGESATAEEALACEEAPDLVVLDMSLKSCDGLDLIKSLRERFPGVAVLVLTMHDTAFHVERALLAGARGYLTKRDAASNVVAALRELLRGEVYITERLSARLLKRVFSKDGPDELARLTRRELQVFLMVGKGLSVHEIASELQLSPKTIETHRASIKNKLKLESSRAVTHHAIRWVARNQDA